MRILPYFKSLALLACIATANLSAQATRTWVSGVGDDANPGSRTAPCKTFAGAISKTAAGGEIDALDPGGFGAVTITKAITLDGGGGQVASILVAGTNGITISAGANDVVVIRNIRINGIVGTGSGGLNGINFLAGKALIVENCIIDGFTQSGIYLSTGASTSVQISNTSILNSRNGVMVEPTNAGAVNLSLEHLRIWDSSNVGLYLLGMGKVVIKDSASIGGVYGLVLDKADVLAENLNSSQNSYVGIQIVGGSLRLSNSVITGNANGLRMLGGVVTSYGNNRIDGNAGANGPLTLISGK